MTFIPQSSFYFIRHGETDWNAQHKIMGWKDISLNKKGREEAEHSAYILKELEIDKIYSSPLKRARETAEIIEQICELEVEEIDGLKEMGFGEAEGKTRSSIGEVSFVSDLNRPQGGEIYQDFEKRILSSIKQVTSATHMYPLIVSHGGVFECLVYILTKKRNFTCLNGEVFYFVPSVINKGSWDVLPIERRF